MLAVLFSGGKACELRLASFSVKVELQGKSPVVLRETPSFFWDLSRAFNSHTCVHTYTFSHTQTHTHFFPFF